MDFQSKCWANLQIWANPANFTFRAASVSAPRVGFGRSVALYYRSSTLYRMC
jgi:hypothetical protein